MHSVGLNFFIMVLPAAGLSEFRYWILAEFLSNNKINFLCLRCKCPPMFDGPECQQTKHSFGGQGYAWFPPIRPCFQSHISLEFLAESANGLLLYNGPLGPVNSGEQEDFIAVGECGHLHCKLIFVHFYSPNNSPKLSSLVIFHFQLCFLLCTDCHTVQSSQL